MPNFSRSSGGSPNSKDAVMELKDVILSTLAEIGEESFVKNEGERPETSRVEKETKETDKKAMREASLAMEETFLEEERLFLEHLRERLLVLFEGFQSPNNKRLEAKIDLTLNFLEYLLATLDERIERLKKP